LWKFGGLGCPGSQHSNLGLTRIIGFAIYEDLDGLVRVSGRPHQRRWVMALILKPLFGFMASTGALTTIMVLISHVG